MTESLMGKRAHKAQMKQKKSAPDKSGSVFEPMKSGREVYGGWADKRSNGGKLATVLGVAVPVGMGAVYFALQRKRGRRNLEEVA
jgi:hypothetical protein